MDYGLCYKDYSDVLEGYSDATWDNVESKSKSMTMWIFILEGIDVTWDYKKRTCTDSMILSKLIACANACKNTFRLCIGTMMMLFSFLELRRLDPTWICRRRSPRWCSHYVYFINLTLFILQIGGECWIFSKDWARKNINRHIFLMNSHNRWSKQWKPLERTDMTIVTDMSIRCI